MGATRLNDTQVAAPPTAFTAIHVITPNGKVLVQPDGGIVVDLEAKPPVIRAPREVSAKYVAKTPGEMFALPEGASIDKTVKVFKNGLLQCEGPDYNIDTEVPPNIYFTEAQGISVGDYVTIYAWA